MTKDPQLHNWAYKRFVEEAPELLETIERNILTLCTDPRDRYVRELMRATHTLKSAAATVELEPIVTVAHAFEDIVQCLYHPDLIIDIELFSMLLDGFDRLRLLVTASMTAAPIDEKKAIGEANKLFDQLRAKLGDYYGRRDSLKSSSSEQGFDLVKAIFEVGIQKRLEILAKFLLKPSKTNDIEVNLRSELELLVGLAESLKLPGFKEIASTALTALTLRPQQASTIAQIVLDDLLQGQEQVLAGDRDRGGEPSPALLQLAQPLPQTPSPANIWEELEQALAEFESAGSAESLDNNKQFNWDDVTVTEIATDASEEANPTVVLERLDNEAIEDADANTIHLSQNNEIAVDWSVLSVANDLDSTVTPTVRVNIEGLQRLDRAIGEMQVFYNRQLSERDRMQAVVQESLALNQQHQQTIERLYDRIANRTEAGEELRALAKDAIAQTSRLQAAIASIAKMSHDGHQTTQRQQRLVSDLQDNSLDARMVPAGEVLDRFIQTVRQLEIVHLKPVELHLSGKNILIDKAIAQKLYAPLLHLIRNAFDHGIEPAEVRRLHKKTEAGRIEIRVARQGWQTTVEVEDDGQGLDFDRIRDRAVALNLFSTEAASQLSTQQLSDLLFEPGFSTSSTISELSGRGIGLEAVKADVESLDGTCQVRSQAYRGTTFALSFPTTLTVVKLTVVRVGTTTYALFSDAIEKIMLPQEEQIARSQGKKFLQYQLAEKRLLVPLYELSELMTYQSPVVSTAPTSQSNAKYVLLLRDGDKRLGIEVDAVTGEQKTAIKPLNSAIAPPTYVYGCSILDQNRLALVIDGVVLVRQTQTLMRQLPQQNAIDGWRAKLLPETIVPTAPLAPSDNTYQSVFLPPPPTILIVDDSISQRQETATALQKAGYRLLQAKNGLDAIEQLQANGDKVRLVVCDIDMPHLNGFEFLSYCRHRQEWSSLPIVMLANRGGRQHRKIALGLGASAYFIRPYIESDFINAIALALST